MMRLRAGLSLLGVLLLSAGSAAAQQALVRSYANTSLEIGQAYLSHYGDRCFAILPTHVAREAGDVAAFLREGVNPVLGESTTITDLGDDVSAADVAGGIRDDCGYSTATVSRAVGSRIKANAIASLRSVSGDGSIAQLSVTIIDDDGEKFLRVQPTRDTDQLRKGQSGSLLMSGDTPIGMLLSVDSRFGVGKVIRFDAIFDKIDAFVRGPSLPQTPATRTQSPERTAAGGTITSWSALPIDAEHRAGNLVGGDDAPTWIARVERWPVQIEMDLPGDRMSIVGVELDGNGVSDPGTLPATVELLVSSTETGRRWRSAAGGRIEFTNGIARIMIAPSWARQIKLVISDAGNGADIVALKRLRVLPAN